MYVLCISQAQVVLSTSPSMQLSSPRDAQAALELTNLLSYFLSAGVIGVYHDTQLPLGFQNPSLSFPEWEIDGILTSGM